MLTANKAFGQSTHSEPELPRVPELESLYRWGIKPRRGQLIMVAGRSGSQKSGFVLFWLAKMGLPTLYFSGDSTPWEMTSRLVSMQTKLKVHDIEQRLNDPDEVGHFKDALKDIPITFSFHSPIKWEEVDIQLDAYMEAHNRYPEIVVIDNFMDIDGCQSDYQSQMEAMQDLTSLSRELGITVIVIHHATDKTDSLPGTPAPRRDIKGGLSEKPQLILSVAFMDGTQDGLLSELRVAAVKQRSGRQDVTASEYVRLIADPETTTFQSRAII